jgi:hypothetical protein
MSPQINENILAEIFVEADDLYKAYLNWCRQHGFTSLFAAKRHSRLSPSEVVTIIIAYHLCPATNALNTITATAFWAPFCMIFPLHLAISAS